MAEESYLKQCRSFIKVYMEKQRKLSPNTIKSYRGTLNQFLDYMVHEKGVPILDVTIDHVNYENVSSYLDWLQTERHCSTVSRNQRLMALRTFGKYCSLSGLEYIAILSDMKKVPTQKVEKKIVDFLSENAMKILLSMPDMKHHYGMRNGCFMIIMYDTAARCQEMLDIKLSDIKKEKDSYYINLHGKGDKTRSVPLTEKTIQHIERYMKFYHPHSSFSDDDLLFYTVSHGKHHPMSADTVARFIDQYSHAAHTVNEEVPVHVHPHQFRHSRAIHLYRGGMPLALLSEFLGHANIETTRIYAYASPEMQAEAINKANHPENSLDVENELWSADEDTIKRLYALK